jgi:two-component system chemotaxis sensor kinase CheA
MDKKDQEFLKQIRETFRIEAEEHLQVFTSGLTELEKTGAKKRIPEIVETLFREIHSLKGAARSVDQKEIESLCIPVESLFSALKRNEISLSPALFDILYKAVESLSKLVSEGDMAKSSADRQIRKELIRQLKEACEKAISPADMAIQEHIVRLTRE